MKWMFVIPAFIFLGLWFTTSVDLDKQPGWVPAVAAMACMIALSALADLIQGRK